MDRLNCGFEVKIAKEAEDGTITGYGSVFRNVDSYGDIVAPGAFKRTLEECKSGGTAWPAMLLQHGDNSAEGMTPIGIWTGLDEDEHGLKLEGKLALETRRGSEAYALLKMQPRPALNGLSIGYRAKDFVMHGKTDKARRTLKSVDLVEVSLVTFPANTAATITAVKAAATIKTRRQLESFLRDEGGFSHAAAKKLASGDIEAGLNLRDEDEDGEQLAAQLKALAKLFNPNF
jgi:HK97 family phage prohead protease